MTEYMQYKGNKFCTEPYRTVCIGTTGGVSPCCALSEMNFGSVTEESANNISQVYDSKYWKRFFKANESGNFPTECQKKCNRPGITTFQSSWQIAEYSKWKLRDKKPVSADIAFGNLCNLSCTMCSSVFSSEWIKIEKKEKGESKYKPWNFSNKQVIELAKYIKDVERIIVKGGEPMYNPRFPLFLKELAKYKTERDFVLFTNLSIIQHEALEYIQQFRLGDQEPFIQASLESCDEDYYKLIRGGKDTSFKNFISNFRTIKENYPKIGIRIHFLINGWTLHRLKEDIDILLENGVTKINFDTIFGPEEQSFVTQNHSCRKKALRVLEDIIEKYPRLIENKQEIINNVKIDYETNYNKGYNIMRTKEFYNRRLLQGVKFNKTYDKMFGEYIKNHV